VPSPSSSKKIERVQRAGAKRSAGTPRPIGFPLGIMAIVLVGALAVFFARESRLDAQSAQPQVNAGWRVAFGVYNCEDWANPVSNSADQATTTGIQWGDGYITVSPSGPEATGSNATFGKFLSRVGISIADGDDGPVATLPAGVLKSGEKLTSGASCAISEGKDKGKKLPAELVLLHWPPKSSEDTDPEVIRDDFDGVRFTEDREIFALALLPKDTKDYPFPTASVKAMSGTTDTTVPESTPPTVAPESTPPSTDAPTTTEAAPASTTTTAGK
jgi:hypothetical protein